MGEDTMRRWAMLLLSLAAFKAPPGETLFLPRFAGAGSAPPFHQAAGTLIAFPPSARALVTADHGLRIAAGSGSELAGVSATLSRVAPPGQFTVITEVTLPKFGSNAEVAALELDEIDPTGGARRAFLILDFGADGRVSSGGVALAGLHFSRDAAMCATVTLDSLGEPPSARIALSGGGSGAASIPVPVLSRRFGAVTLTAPPGGWLVLHRMTVSRDPY